MGKTKREIHRSKMLAAIYSGKGLDPERLVDAILDAIEDVPKKKTKKVTAGSQVWDAYADAFHRRHAVEPLRNAKINGMLKALVERIGAQEAVHVARFYVEHPNTFYANRMHAVELLLRDCESLYVQWKKNKPMIESRSDQGQSNIGQPWKELE